MNEGKTFGIYAVKDNLLGRFMQPVFMDNNEDVAKRWFKFAINETPSWKSSAADYTLHKIGEFNDATGINDYPVIEEIANGLSMVERS